MNDNVNAHPIADIFPTMSNEDYIRLKHDIRENGQIDPVWLYEGKILDGRHRYKACSELGMEPETETFEGSHDEALTFSLSVNLARRHMTTEQKAALGAEIKQYEAEAARERQGERTDISGNNIVEKLPQGSAGKARDKAGEQVGVSGRTVDDADRIRKSAPDVFGRMKQGQYGSMANAKRVADLEPEDRDEVHRQLEDGEADDAKDAVRNVKRKRRREDRVKNIQKLESKATPLSTIDKRYPVIYADPPWRYQHSKTDNRKIENHYPTMTLDDICDMPVADIATDDSVLLLWATNPKLEEALRVLNAWGFTYKTNMCWDKQKIGMGYYARQQHELLLIGTKGSPPAPEPSVRPPSVLSQKRQEHSKKPDKYYEIIEALYPEYSKIELFCREPVDGWDAWGNEADNE